MHRHACHLSRLRIFPRGEKMGKMFLKSRGETIETIVSPIPGGGNWKNVRRFRWQEIGNIPYLLHPHGFQKLIEHYQVPFIRCTYSGANHVAKINCSLELKSAAARKKCSANGPSTIANYGMRLGSAPKFGTLLGVNGTTSGEHYFGESE